MSPAAATAESKESRPIVEVDAEAISRDVEEVFASLRSLTHSGRTVVTAGGTALERELNMAIRLSEQVRDSMITAKTLKEAREQKLNISLRADGHRIVDLAADIGGVAALAAGRIADGLLTTPRLLADGAPAAAE